MLGSIIARRRPFSNRIGAIKMGRVEREWVMLAIGMKGESKFDRFIFANTIVELCALAAIYILVVNNVILESLAFPLFVVTSILHWIIWLIVALVRHYRRDKQPDQTP